MDKPKTPTPADPQVAFSSLELQDEKQREAPCAACRKAADAIVKWPHASAHQPVNLGNWQGFLDRSQCRTCQQIVHHCNVNKDVTEVDLLSSFVSLYKLHLGTFWIKSDATEHNMFPILIPSSTLSPEGPHYITVDSQWINISQLRGWLAKCNTDHGAVCHSILRTCTTGASPSMTLIDLRKECLVTSTKPVEYVALSYVWGKTPGSLMATTENLPYLFTPGALAETSSQIPRTILDAMHLTKEMGVDYLWVDRLCIVQGSIRHFNEQLQQMAAIYANSSFTIIATSGEDANHGLLGVGGQSLPRHFEQTYLELSPEVTLLCRPPSEAQVGISTWYTRAWTFQERALSRKTLVVGANSVYWLCRTSEWQEYKSSPSTVALSARYLASWPFHALMVKRWPDFQQYTTYVHDYNKRSLTFESDALKAFTAILTALTPSFPGGFFFGLPEFLFDLGLLWSVSTPLKRRTDFPSWSWLGWSGAIIFPTDSAWNPKILDWNPTPDAFLHAVTLIDWHKFRAADDTRVRIDNSYSQYQSMAGNSEIEVPEGWVREKFTYDDRLDEESHDIYLHPLLEEESGFKFPVPIAPELATVAPDPDIWSPVLRFRAKRCTMFLGKAFDFRKRKKASTVLRECLHIELCDSKGSRTGVVESSFMNEKDYIQGSQCKLIAISMLSVPQAHPERTEDVPEINVFPELEEVDPAVFYNVLWVEWKNGIAYRKALGRVTKDAWEKQDLEEIDVALG